MNEIPFFRERVFIAVGGAAILAAMALLDYWRHPDNPTRLKEYAFLLYATLVAVAYAIAHDHATATISPEYFLRWKGLADDPRPFRWAVTVLAVRASVATGLAAGTVLLVANNSLPGRKLPRLSYGELARLSLVPLASAALLAVAWGVINARLRIGAATASGYVATERVRAFVTVWAVHAGSYAGALVGIVLGGFMVAVRRRERARALAATARVHDGG
jgi:hypothetical protein